jgi:hypothetical protein
MKNLILLFFLLCVFNAWSQDAIKNVLVEIYYISDARDATDTIGGKLEAGSKTYRIYVQLKPGCKLLSIYGDKYNTLKIISTAPFFNNISDGVTFAKDMKVNYLRNNTVALDSWITLGQTTKKGTKTYFGIPKSQDTNGSIVGGTNNDGGSANVQGGLLSNTDPLAGVPLTIADGMDTLTKVASDWVNYGFNDFISGVDSTIFGSVKPGSEFVSNSAYLGNAGTVGVNADSNQVLVAQLTTKGEISFELNVQVFDPNANQSYRSLYVAEGRDSINEVERTITKVSPYLKYPAAPVVCGCLDPNFLEYNKKYACNAQDQCQTRAVLGCMDPMSCNYNPDANYNVPGLCCYPGHCYDRDLSQACPAEEDMLQLNVYPNPAVSQITIETSPIAEKETKYFVYNYFGKLVLERDLGIVNGKVSDELNLSGFDTGMYVVRLVAGNSSDSRIFIKN